MSNGSLRRAAILIACLETESADALLDEMAPDQAVLVRNAVMELGDIDIVEQQEVIEQFVGNRPQAIPPADTGVEIDPNLARKFESPTEKARDVTGTTETPRQPEVRPFAFLDEVESDELARVLSGEHPQTTAIVVAHLAPAHAAGTLARLPRPRQTEALMRIARLRTPHPDVIRDLEQEMQSLLANRQRREQVGATGLAAVEAILQNTSTAVRHDLVADLSQQDQMLVRQLHSATSGQAANAAGRADQATAASSDGESPSSQLSNLHAKVDRYRSDELIASSKPTLDFSDLERLDNSALALILHRGSTNTTLLALAGASHQFVQRIVSQLPGREAAQLDRRIQQIGPLRLDDVHRAQQQLADIAQQLIDEGRLIAPETQRLSVAA